MGLQALAFVVHRSEGGGDVTRSRLIRRSHRGLRTKDDIAPQLVHGRTQQLAGVLVVRGTFIELLELLGASHAFKGATHHHRDGAALDKALEDFTEHDGLLWHMR